MGNDFTGMAKIHAQNYAFKNNSVNVAGCTDMKHICVLALSWHFTMASWNVEIDIL